MLNISQLYRPLRPVTEIALHFFLVLFNNCQWMMDMEQLVSFCRCPELGSNSGSSSSEEEGDKLHHMERARAKFEFPKL
jgi:hypothetical protein